MYKELLFAGINKISQNMFLLISLGLAVIGTVFHFWLAYPGFLNWDGYMLMVDNDNIQPIIVAKFFWVLFSLFGYHVWYALLLLLIPFYFGMWLIVFGFYRRYKSWYSLAGFFPILIQTIFVPFFFILSGSFEASYSFMLYSCLLYIILNPKQKNKSGLIGLIVISITVSLFVRHNGIVQIFPAIAFMVYMFSIKKSKFLLRYLGLVFTISIILLGSKIIIENTISEDFKKPHQHVFTNQLAAMCVPENDASCFDESWFLPGKSFEDMKKVYYEYPLIADYFGFKEDECGMHIQKIVAKGIEKKWIEAVLKYPKNFIIHEIKLIKSLWLTPIQFLEYSPDGPKSPFYETFNFYEKEWRFENFQFFPKEELYMHETPLKKHILHIWDDYLPKIPTLFWIFYMLTVGVATTIMLFLRKKDRSIIYCFHLSWGGLLASVMYGMFYPNLFWRYIQIIWVFGICITYGVSIYILDNINKKQQEN